MCEKVRRVEMLKKKKRMLSIVLVTVMLLMNVPLTVLGSFDVNVPIDGPSVLRDPFVFMYDADELLVERLHEMVTSSIIVSDVIENYENVGNQRRIDDRVIPSSERAELQDMILEEFESLPMESEVLEIITELPDSYLKQALAYHEELYVDRFIVKFRADNQANARSSQMMGSESFIETFTQSFTQSYSQDLTKNTSYASQSLAQSFGTQSFGRMELIVLDERVNPRELADELRASGAGQYIEYIQPDFTLSLAGLIDDESSVVESSLNEPPQVTSSPTSLGFGNSVLVAVIDTGIDSSHPMLVDYVVEGWNFPSQNSITFDPTHPLASAHGTHIAGIIASAARESGADIRIMPLQVFENGRAYTSDIIAAINFAVERGAAIINSSFGSTEENPALYEMITNTNALFVCAVGNNRRDMDVMPSYPAAYRLSNVISVGSVNADGGLSFFSNYSANLVDITAPGRDIVSALPSGQIGLLSGTSMSTAYVTGIAAVLLSQSPDMTPSELRERILSSADRLSNLQTTVNYGRRANMANTLAGVVGSSLSLEPDDDFNVHGYQPTREEIWELFAAAGSVVQVAGGGTHSIALMSNGTVWAWGANDVGQLGQGTRTPSESFIQVVGLSDITYISAGGNHNLALRADGTVWSWGNNLWGQLGDGTNVLRLTPIQVSGLSDAVAISADLNHSLAIRANGTAWSWGRNESGQLGDGTTTNRLTAIQVSGLNNVISVTSGGNYSLALRSDRTVWSWGNNTNGRLGDGTTIQRLTPVQVSVLTNITAITAGGTNAGDGHSLALRSDGTVWSWGRNQWGQLGDGTTVQRLIPVQVSGLSEAVSIAAGGGHSIALRTDGTVWTWGNNFNNQLGDGTTTHRFTPVQVNGLSDVVAIATGGAHNIALRSDDSMWSWGWNSGGQSDGIVIQRLVPMRVNDLTEITAVSAGARHSLALRTDGTVWSWGNNFNGQLGDGTTIARTSPIQVSGLSDIIDIVAGTDHSLALRSDGTVWAWGSNGNGRLGDGTVMTRTSPVQVRELTDIIAITAGIEHSMALRSDGTVWAWGSNWQSQLGDGTTTHRFTPVQVSALTDIVDLAAGGSHSMALRSDGTVWSWGSNSAGQLGDGTITQRLTPVQAVGLSDVTAIESGGSHSLALRSDGTMWVWGRNESGQLGDGTTTRRLTPIQVRELSDVTAIAGGGPNAGASHSLALMSDGTVWVWGSNAWGQLGDGTTIGRRTPIQVSGLSDVTAIAGGITHSLVVDGNRVRAFGDDREGQLGLGRILQTSVPILVRIGRDDSGKPVDDERVEINVTAGEMYTFVLSGYEIEDFSDKVFRLTFDPLAVRLRDIAAQTRSPSTNPDNISVGPVRRTDMVIVSISHGELRFRMTTPIQDDMLWTGMLTIIQFDALITGQTTVGFSIE